MSRPRIDPPGRVELRPLKAAALALPGTSVARRLILGEPDAVSRRDYLAAAEIIATAIFAEIEAASVTKATAENVGGVIVRLADGEAT